MSSTKPYPYQQEGVDQIAKWGYVALLADEMGLGKSPQALWAALRANEWPVIVVCPASLKWQWEREVAKHLGMSALVLETRRPPWRKLPPSRFYVVNYEILAAWLPLLRKLNAKMVVFDECHYITNRSAKRTKAARKLAKRIPHRIALSGTPLTNRPSELWSVLNILRPDLYPSFFSYAMDYCNPQKIYGRWEYKGARNLDKLHAELREHLMIRRLKKDVLKDLPPKQRSVISLSVKNRKEYDHAMSDFRGWLRKNGKRMKKSRRLKTEALVKMTMLKRLAGKIKAEAVVEWVDNFLQENEGKLLIFGIHRDVLKPLYARYKDQAVLVDGSVVGRKRQEKFDLFNGDRKTRLCIGNIHAAGVGWSAKGKKLPINTVVFIELDWKPATMIQAEDRCYGLGRGVEGVGTNVFYLVTRNTIEEKILALNEAKQGVSDQILDGRDEGETTLDIHSQLQAEILKESNNARGRSTHSVLKA